MNRVVFLFFFCCILAVASCTSYFFERIRDSSDNATAETEFEFIPTLRYEHIYSRGFFSAGCTPSRSEHTFDEITRDFSSNRTLLDFIHSIEFPSITIPTTDWRRELLIRDSCYIRGTPTDPPLHNETLNDLAPYFGPSVHYLY